MDCLGGWVPTLENWTYASATTITVPSDATTKYSIGDKIRIKQGGGYKYFYVVEITSTVLTVTGGSDYSVANSAITDNYYSKVTSPLDFPQVFNYVPTWGGFSTDPSSLTAKFSIVGRTCHLWVSPAAAGVSNAATLTVTAPVAPAATLIMGGATAVYDNGVFLATPGRIETASGSITIACYKSNTQSVAWTASGGKIITFAISYPI